MSGAFALSEQLELVDQIRAGTVRNRLVGSMQDGMLQSGGTKGFDRARSRHMNTPPPGRQGTGMPPLG